MTSPPPPPPPQWMLDLDSKPSLPKSKPGSIPDPPGYAMRQVKKGTSNKQVEPRKPPTQEETDSLKLKKAWEVAIAPAKQLPMNAIGIYMTGNSLQIFSIFMLFTLFKGPLTALLGMNTTFQRFETPRTAQQFLLVKAAYVGCNLLVLALGVWKVNQMGLLPTTRSDWLSWEREVDCVERGVRAEL